MKDLLKKALGDLASLPYTSTKKTIEKKIYLDDYSLSEVIKKAEAVGVSFDKISVETDEADTLGVTNPIYLSYPVEVDMTKADIEKDIKYRFNRGAFKRVYDALTPNGYKRISSSSVKHREFSQYNVYDLYMAGDFDALEAYYSLFFKKNEEGL